MPDTLQLGITTYSDWLSVAKVYPDNESYNRYGTPDDKGDLVAYFDYIAIEPGSVEKEMPMANFIGEQVLNVLNSQGGK